MYKRTRRKISASIMASLIFMFVLSLCVILGAGLLEIRRRNYEKLERYAELFHLEKEGELPEPGQTSRSNSAPKPDSAPAPLSVPNLRDGVPGFESRPDFELSTFYSAAFSSKGEVLAVDDGKAAFYTEDEIVETAREVLAGGRRSGKSGKLLYIVKYTPGYTLVAFLDNTVTDSSLDILLRTFIITGGSSILLYFFISLLISKRIVRPLAENDRKQKQFISDASHELKTPVSVISANAELLSREIGKNEWLDNIIYENERMGSLLKELLDLSRAENAETSMEDIDLSNLITGEILAFEVLAFDRGKTINSRIEENVSIRANRTAMEQLVSILLDNAIKHSTGNRIDFLLKTSGRWAVLCVENEADPIAPDKAEHLFDRFYRLDEARSSDGHYGLGLSIAKAVTDGHKGSIGVSCGDGKVRFTVSLPL